MIMKLRIYHYKFIFKFDIITMYIKGVGIILGSNWLEKLRTFMLNMEKVYNIFLLKKFKMLLKLGRSSGTNQHCPCNKKKY